MKQSRSHLPDLVQLPLDPSVVVVSRRFLVRLAIIVVLSAFPITGAIGFRPVFLALTTVNIVVCSIYGALRREAIRSNGLTHWDEALVLLGLWFTGHLI